MKAVVSLAFIWLAPLLLDWGSIHRVQLLCPLIFAGCAIVNFKGGEKVLSVIVAAFVSTHWIHEISGATIGVGRIEVSAFALPTAVVIAIYGWRPLQREMKSNKAGMRPWSLLAISWLVIILVQTLLYALAIIKYASIESRLEMHVATIVFTLSTGLFYLEISGIAVYKIKSHE